MKEVREEDLVIWGGSRYKLSVGYLGVKAGFGRLGSSMTLLTGGWMVC